MSSPRAPEEATPALTDHTRASTETTSTEPGDVVVDIEGKKLPNVDSKLSLAESQYYAGKSMARNSALLEPIPSEKRIVLTFSNVNSWVPNLGLGEPEAKKGGDKGESEATSKRQTLFDVSGGALPGDVLALMGPSGSGKTSLISMLGGRAQSAITVKGDIKFNDKAPSKALKRRMGFVLQDDMMYAELTVYETLYFAAQLRLPQTMSKEEKTGRVEKVIQALGLDKCRNTIIGGFMQRGVSGGERKRVSVGHEMLINPSIIFLDEPTSGLDSTTALSLVTTLHGLAEGGRTVITTIHQPSSRMFQKLEKLMLLSDGRVMYYGNTRNCVDWFKGLNCHCPFGVNVADWILDLASANQGTTKEEGLEIRALQANAFRKLTKNDMYQIEMGVTSDVVDKSPAILEELLAETDGAVLHTGGAQTTQTGMMKKLGSLASSMSHRPKKPEEEDQALVGGWGSSWATQFLVLLTRAVKVRRFEALGIQKFAQLAAVAALTGLFWWQRGQSDDVQAARDTAGLIFFEGLYMTFQSMFVALFVFPTELRMVMKERSSGMYRLSAYYLSRTASDLPMDCFYPSLFVFIVYFMGGLKLSAAAFFSNWSQTILSLLTAQSFGLMLGAGVTNVKTAQTAATIFMLATMLVGGFFLAFVPAWIAWVKYISFIYYTYIILMHIEFSGRTIYDCSAGSDACVTVDTQTALGLAKDPNEPVYFEVGMMFVLLVVMRVATYVVLNRKTKRN